MSRLVCALTGHRELPADFDRNLLFDTLEELIGKGYTTFFCGMAVGFDLLALQCLVDLKRKYRVRVEACVPYAGQAAGFPPQERKRYRELIRSCDGVNVLSEHYYAGCMLVRDRYMVDRADLVLAYCTKKRSGTAYTVNYARDHGVEVKFLGDFCDF